MMAFAAVMLFAISSCTKEDNIVPIVMDSEPDVITTIKLDGTSWQGVKDTTYLGYDIRLDWTFDFTSETEAVVRVQLGLAGQTATRQVDASYIFNGTEGTITFWNKTFEMTYNTTDSTLVVPNLTMSLSDGNEITEVGGETVFHKR